MPKNNHIDDLCRRVRMVPFFLGRRALLCLLLAGCVIVFNRSCLAADSKYDSIKLLSYGDPFCQTNHVAVKNK